jgi:hypothetical protein
MNIGSLHNWIWRSFDFAHQKRRYWYDMIWQILTIKHVGFKFRKNGDCSENFNRLVSIVLPMGLYQSHSEVWWGTQGIGVRMNGPCPSSILPCRESKRAADDTPVDWWDMCLVMRLYCYYSTGTGMWLYPVCCWSILLYVVVKWYHQWWVKQQSLVTW